MFEGRMICGFSRFSKFDDDNNISGSSTESDRKALTRFMVLPPGCELSENSRWRFVMLTGLRTLLAIALPIASISVAQPIRPLPVLPPELQDRADRIVVKVGFFVGYDGKPSAIRLISGNGSAYGVVAKAVLQWKYSNSDVPRLVDVEFSWSEGKARIQSYGEQRFSPHYSPPKYRLKPESAPRAVYPDQARLAGITGYMLVQMNLNRDGSVKDAHV